MAEYEVILEREVTEEGYVTVEAESDDEAKLKAEAIPPDEISWDRTESRKHWAISAEEGPEDAIKES